MTARSTFWQRLIGRSPEADTATELYGRLVAAARAPAVYASLGAPDTPEGRLEVIVMYVVLMLRRLSSEGPEMASLSRALTETFVTDMDDCLREMGGSDISVARKVKKAAAALFDRSRAYGAALEAGDRDGLARPLAEHVLALPQAGQGISSAAALRLADHAMAVDNALAGASLADILAGRVTLPELTD